MELTAHAYLVRGGPEASAEVLRLLEKDGVETKGNSDVFLHVYSSFTIADARALRERAALRARSESGRVFIISAPTVPTDAQNALLKTFEEPAVGARFFLIVPSPEMLLPTLRSRMQTLDVVSGHAISPVDAKEFLRSASEKRLELLKPLLEKGDDDKRDLSGMLAFLSEIEKTLAEKPRENEKGLKAVFRARRYITDRGTLAKVLLEQTALIVPKVL